MVSKFQGDSKNFATSAFGLQPFMGILEFRYICISLEFAFRADHCCFIVFVYINFYHQLSSNYLFQHNIPKFVSSLSTFSLKIGCGFKIIIQDLPYFQW